MAKEKIEFVITNNNQIETGERKLKEVISKRIQKLFENGDADRQ